MNHKEKSYVFTLDFRSMFQIGYLIGYFWPFYLMHIFSYFLFKKSKLLHNTNSRFNIWCFKLLKRSLDIQFKAAQVAKKCLKRYCAINSLTLHIFIMIVFTLQKSLSCEFITQAFDLSILCPFLHISLIFLTNQVFACVFPFVHVDVCRLRFHSSNFIPSRTNKHSKKF